MLQKENFFRRPDPAPARGLMPPAPPAPAPMPVHEAAKPAEKSEDRKEAKLIVGPDARIKVEEGAELSGEISVLERSPAVVLPKRVNPS